MRQLLKSTLLFFSLSSLWSCSKDDDFLATWKCNIEEQSLPAGDSAKIFLPNAFTPNGDGLNDLFVPVCTDITNITFIVYDNEKNILFKTTELGKGWDGLSKTGDQYNIIHYTVEGVSGSGNRIARCGSGYRLTCVPKGVSRSNLIFSDQYDPAMPEGYLRDTSMEALEDCQ